MKFILTCILFISLMVPGIRADESPEILVAAIKDILHDFSYQLKPVHPGCVKEFDVSLADSPPPIVRAVDIRACVTSNELFMPFKTGDDGYIGYEYDLGDGEKGSFAYKYLGKSESGIFVLATRSSGGGTMVAESLFLIKDSFENYWDFDNENKKTLDRRLIMTCVGQITLGDRDTGKVSLEGNRLILSPSQYREKAVTIDLDMERFK
jgi:hypothetical protein